MKISVLVAALLLGVLQVKGDCRGYVDPPYCQTECPQGSFGERCEDTCHCPAGDSCVPFNGHCSSKQCLYGWTGPSCQTRLPYLSHAPTSNTITSRSVSLQWPAWDPANDPGTDSLAIAFYHVEYQASANTSQWIRTVSIDSNAETSSYAYTVDDLLPNEGYCFRISLSFWSHEKRVESIPAVESVCVRTVCEAPEDSPRINTSLISMNKSCVDILWMPPRFVNCNSSVSYLMHVFCEFVCGEGFSVLPHATTPSASFCFPPPRLSVTIFAVNEAQFVSPASETIHIMNGASVTILPADNDAGADLMAPPPGVFISTHIESYEDLPLPSRLVLEDRTRSSLVFRPILPRRRDIPTDFFKAFQISVSSTETSPSDTGPVIMPDTLLRLYNLTSATFYNITIQSRSSDPTALHVMASTAPPPTTIPAPPILLNISSQSAQLKLQVLKQDHRDITSCYLMVERLLDGLSTLQNQVVNATDTMDFCYDNLVAHTYSKPPWKSLKDLDFDAASAEGLPYYVAAELCQAGVFGEMDVTIGDITSKYGFFNAPLHSNTEYKAWFVTSRETDGVGCYSLNGVNFKTLLPLVIEAPIVGKPGGDDSILLAGVLAGIIALLILTGVIGGVFWKRKRAQQLYYSDIRATYRHTESLTDRSLNGNNNSGSQNLAQGCSDVLDLSNLGQGIEIRVPRREVREGDCVVKKSNPLLAKKLRGYIELRENSEFTFADEFKHLPQGSVDSCNVANQPHNMMYNRSAYVVPFDKNRVNLAKLSPEDNAYINASFVQSVSNKYFIVTQCPMTTTSAEFWRMIWEQDVHVIVMLVALKEEGRAEYDRYWPERPSHPYVYNNLEVSKLTEESTAHYILRTLSLTHIITGETRVIQHWQYKSWCLGGIPQHAITFLDFTRRVQEERGGGTYTVVHCHTGGGRSGLYLALDSLLTQGRQTGKVDILHCVTHLRCERVHLMKTLKQYRFLHECLAEVFDHSETRIPLDRFLFAFDNIIDVEGKKGYSVLACEFSSLPPTHSSHAQPQQPQSFHDYSTFFSPFGARQEENIMMLRLLSETEGAGGYSAIALLDSYLHRDNFLLADPPSGPVLPDYWNMIFENETHSIVLLNPKADCSLVYWPSETMTCGPLQITRSSSDDLHPVIIHNMSLSFSGKASRTRHVKLYEFAAWAADLDTPPVQVLIKLVAMVMEDLGDERKRGPVVVQSSCGGDRSRSALFCVVWTLVECVQTLNVVDIFSQVRLIREVVPNAIHNLEQYRYLYKVVKSILLKQEVVSASIATNLFTSIATTSRASPVKPHSSCPSTARSKK